jgi:hypothetical protein
MSTTSLWPFDNNVNVSDLTRQQRKERELFIQNAMEIFSWLPFQIGDSQLHRPNVSIKPLNWNERGILESELYDLNGYINGLYNDQYAVMKHVPKELYIPYDRLVYDSVKTRIEYWPFTSAGRYNPQPLRIHFSTIPESSAVYPIESTGELRWGVDGKVCAATVRIFVNSVCYSYSFGVVGRTFMITKLETPGINGKPAILYSSSWELMDWK